MHINNWEVRYGLRLVRWVIIRLVETHRSPAAVTKPSIFTTTQETTEVRQGENLRNFPRLSLRRYCQRS